MSLRFFIMESKLTSRPRFSSFFAMLSGLFSRLFTVLIGFRVLFTLLSLFRISSFVSTCFSLFVVSSMYPSSSSNSSFKISDTVCSFVSLIFGSSGIYSIISFVSGRFVISAIESSTISLSFEASTISSSTESVSSVSLFSF